MIFDAVLCIFSSAKDSIHKQIHIASLSISFIFSLFLTLFPVSNLLIVLVASIGELRGDGKLIDEGALNLQYTLTYLNNNITCTHTRIENQLKANKKTLCLSRGSRSEMTIKYLY